MATALDSIKCGVSLGANQSHTIQGEAIAHNKIMSFAASFTGSGTTANKADRWYFEIDRALTSASNDDLDVYDFAVFDNATDALGNAITLAEIVAVIVRNQTTSAGNLVLGGNGTTAAWNSVFSASDTATITLHPGGIFLVAAPDDPAYAVADTSNHLLRVNASGGNITYDIGILGRSA